MSWKFSSLLALANTTARWGGLFLTTVGFAAIIKGMGLTEIIALLPKLTHKERRAVARRIIELEGEAQLLADCDRRADANFKMLDVMEAEDDGSPC